LGTTLLGDAPAGADLLIWSRVDPREGSGNGEDGMKSGITVSVLLGLIDGVAVRPAWYDQWTSALTPTSAQAANYNGALSV